MNNKTGKILLAVAAVALTASPAFATDPTGTEMVTAANSAFSTVAPLAIAVGSFLVVVVTARRIWGRVAK